MQSAARSGANQPHRFPPDGSGAVGLWAQEVRLLTSSLAVHSAATRKTKINNGESGSLARKGEIL